MPISEHNCLKLVEESYDQGYKDAYAEFEKDIDNIASLDGEELEKAVAELYEKIRKQNEETT